MNTINVRGTQVEVAKDGSLFNIRQRQILAGLIGVTQQLAQHNAEDHTVLAALTDLGLHELIESVAMESPAMIFDYIYENTYRLVLQWVHPDDRHTIMHAFDKALGQVLLDREELKAL